MIVLILVILHYLQTGMTVNGGLGLMCMGLMETTTGETGHGITMGMKLNGKQSECYGL